MDQSARGPGLQAWPSATSWSRWLVGTCSWSKVTTVAAIGPPAEGLEVAVVAHLRRRNDLGSGGVARLREQPERYAEPHRRLLHHPGQLAGTDDADDGSLHGRQTSARAPGASQTPRLGRRAGRLGDRAPPLVASAGRHVT